MDTNPISSLTWLQAGPGLSGGHLGFEKAGCEVRGVQSPSREVPTMSRSGNSMLRTFLTEHTGPAACPGDFPSNRAPLLIGQRLVLHHHEVLAEVF